MKIGVAIPSYIGHIEQLFQLLDSIQTQTTLPNKVVVSCSSTKNTDFVSYSEKMKHYSFILEVITTEEKKCAAQNRNIAAFKLSDMDYITFIDADDIMHPQRIELLLKVFQHDNSDIILHNYYNSEMFDNTMIKKIETCNVRIKSLKQCYSGCITHKMNYNRNDKIHHGHVSVKQSIFSQVQFPEEPQFYTKEDCVFCHRVFSLPNIIDSYIVDELTYYKPSNTQILYFSK